jgi:hypothetical protein
MNEVGDRAAAEMKEQSRNEISLITKALAEAPVERLVRQRFHSLVVLSSFAFGAA